MVLAMSRAFPSAPLVTSVFDPPTTFSAFSQRDIRTTRLQSVPLLRQHHRLGFPVYAPTFGRLTVDASLVLCSTSGWAHGVRSTGMKALYVHNTPRWIYQADEYLTGTYSAARALATPLSRPLRRWNHRSASSADKIWVNSKTVQERVWRHWALDSEVLYPPHSSDPTAPREEVVGLEPGYLLAVSRLLHYKRVDAVVEAMRELPHLQLAVVGDGPENRRLRALAPKNCRFLGRVSDENLRWLYANCACLVSAAHEDLGLVPLEAMAFGRPVAVLRRAGFLETVVEGQTGVFFDTPEPHAIAKAVRALTASSWSTSHITTWADRFSEQSFVDRLREGIRNLIGEGIPAVESVKGV